MNPSKRISAHFNTALIAVVFLLLTPSLSAQNSGRGFFKAHSGASLNSSGMNLTNAGGFGLRLTDFLDVYAEAGTMRDVITPALNNELAATANRITQNFNVPLELSGTLSAQYALIGSRVTVPLRSVVTPFFEIGGGAASLSYDIQSSIGGVVHSPFFREEFRDLLEVSMMLSASAGAHLAVTRRFGFDFAYRYFRISSSAPGVSGNQFYAGIVYRF